MDVIGIVIHAELQLRMVTCTAYSGLESMAVTGIVVHVGLQLRMVT